MWASYEGSNDTEVVSWAVAVGAAGYTHVDSSEFTIVATRPGDLQMDVEDYIVLDTCKEIYTWDDITEDMREDYDITEDMDITIIVPVSDTRRIDGNTDVTTV